MSKYFTFIPLENWVFIFHIRVNYNILICLIKLSQQVKRKIKIIFTF